MLGRTVRRIRVANPFVIRSVRPGPESFAGRQVTGLRRLGKRIAIGCDGPWMVIHLMIAGRLQWRPPDARVPGKLGLMSVDVDGGTLLLTEAGTTRRAAVHLLDDDVALNALDPGGLDVLQADVEAFTERLLRERHTLKRSLTDPHLFSGIGNAYSDEILHRARLSPLKMSDSLTAGEQARLYDAARLTLTEWRDRLISDAADAFPAKVTAFRDGMAVHGRYGLPCPVCATPVQRLRYAANEANYCPECQTGGRLLADRGLSRLLKGDWPRSLEDLERRKATGREAVAATRQRLANKPAPPEG
jgi:formamidopyrimidine-DNA glycosylase